MRSLKRMADVAVGAHEKRSDGHFRHIYYVFNLHGEESRVRREMGLRLFLAFSLLSIAGCATMSSPGGDPFDGGDVHVAGTIGRPLAPSPSGEERTFALRDI